MLAALKKPLIAMGFSSDKGPSLGVSPMHLDKLYVSFSIHLLGILYSLGIKPALLIIVKPTIHK